MTENFRNVIEQILDKWQHDENVEGIQAMKRAAAGYAVFFTELMADGLTREEAFELTAQLIVNLGDYHE